MHLRLISVHPSITIPPNFLQSMIIWLSPQLTRETILKDATSKIDEGIGYRRGFELLDSNSLISEDVNPQLAYPTTNKRSVHEGFKKLD